MNRLLEDLDTMPANLICQAAHGGDGVGIKLLDDFNGLRQVAESGQEPGLAPFADVRRDLGHRLAAQRPLKIYICNESRMRLITGAAQGAIGGAADAQQRFAGDFLRRHALQPAADVR